MVSTSELQGQTASNLKSDKLIGDVKMVRTEQTWTTKKGESNRVLMTTETYDQQGNKVEWNAYKGSDKPLRSLFAYDEKGKVTEQIWYNSAEELIAKTIFGYDEKGNLVEEKSSNGIKVLYSYDSRNNKTLARSFDLAIDEGPRMFGDINRTVRYFYDKRNNLIKIASFKPAGSRVWNPELQAHKILYRYDRKGRITSQTVFNADNSIRTKVQSVYDSKDRLVKESLFTGEDRKTTVYKYGYRVDGRGNWIAQFKTKQVIRNRTPSFPVIETIYRTIEYRD